jgi:hypothetical protein
LDRDALYFVLLLVKLPFEGVEVSFEQDFSLASIFIELFFESFGFHFQ